MKLSGSIRLLILATAAALFAAVAWRVVEYAIAARLARMFVTPM
jgi:hypothetical protein